MAVSINGTSGISGVDGSAGTPALQGSDTNTGISFGTDEVLISTGGTERAKIDASGYLRLASGGIQFNSDTGAVNALNDYEEGTWTPYYTTASVTVPYVSEAFSAGAYAFQIGTYIKVGKTVNAWFYFQNNPTGFAYANGAASGQGVFIGGLPYTPTPIGGSVSHFGSGSIGYYANWGGWGAGYPPMVYAANGLPCCALVYPTAVNVTQIPLGQMAQVNVVTLGRVTYTTA